jgi:hypothetical protein
VTPIMILIAWIGKMSLKNSYKDVIKWQTVIHFQ